MTFGGKIRSMRTRKKESSHIIIIRELKMLKDSQHKETYTLFLSLSLTHTKMKNIKQKIVIVFLGIHQNIELK